METGNKVTGAFGVKLLHNVSARNITSMHCGGYISNVFIAENIEDIAHFLASNNRLFILGEGTNTIFGDTPIDIPVLRLGNNFSFIELKGETIHAGAKTPINEILTFCIKEGLSGLEFLSGIPGSLGGSLFMNAGTRDEWIMDRVISIELTGRNGEFNLKREDIHPSYRSGNLPDKVVITGAYLKVDPSNPKHVQERISDYLEKRRNQPKGFTSGSVFKNPEGMSAGYLIEEAGLKGYRIGGAMVSPLHANFIVNDGDASASDVKKLIDVIKQRVKSRFGIELKEEVKLIG